MTTDDIPIYGHQIGSARYEDVVNHHKVESVTVSNDHITVTLKKSYYPQAIRIARSMGDAAAYFRLLAVLAR